MANRGIGDVDWRTLIEHALPGLSIECIPELKRLPHCASYAAMFGSEAEQLFSDGACSRFSILKRRSGAKHRSLFIRWRELARPRFGMARNARVSRQYFISTCCKPSGSSVSTLGQYPTVVWRW